MLTLINTAGPVHTVPALRRLLAQVEAGIRSHDGRETAPALWADDGVKIRTWQDATGTHIIEIVEASDA